MLRLLLVMIILPVSAALAEQPKPPAWTLACKANLESARDKFLGNKAKPPVSVDQRPTRAQLITISLKLPSGTPVEYEASLLGAPGKLGNMEVTWTSSEGGERNARYVTWTKFQSGLVATVKTSVGKLKAHSQFVELFQAALDNCITVSSGSLNLIPGQ